MLKSILNCNSMEWQDASNIYVPGTKMKMLRDDEGGRTLILKIPPNFKMEEHAHVKTEQHFVLKGQYEIEGKAKHEVGKKVGELLNEQKIFTDSKIKDTYEKIDLGEMVDKVNLNEQLEISKSSLEARGYVEADLIAQQVKAGIEANYKFDWTKITRRKVK